MLSRVADAMYWMNRYVERAQHVSRVIIETSNVLVDVGDFSAHLRQEHWLGVLRIFCLDQTERAQKLLNGTDELVAGQIPAYMTFDAENPNSLLSSITLARENARSIREQISGEMWENLNALYWSLHGEDARSRFEEAPQEFYRQTLNGTMFFQGLTQQTLTHGQGWLFARVGQFLERIDMACRVLGTKLEILQKLEHELETPERNIHWMSLLRTGASLEAFRRLQVGDLDMRSVLAFLVLEKQFPQSIRFSVQNAHEAVSRIRAGVNPHGVDPAERILGRLSTQLEYADIDELITAGTVGFLRQIEEGAAQAAETLRKSYFMY